MEGEIVPVGVVVNAQTAFVILDQIGGQIIPIGTIKLQAQKGFAGSITPTGNVIASLPATQSVGGSITPVGTFVSGVKINLAAVRKRRWIFFFMKR
jgi:hypothetical protein